MFVKAAFSLLLCLCFANLSFAQGKDQYDWMVLAVKGKASCGRIALQKGLSFKTGCVARTNANSAVKLADRSGVLVVLGPDSKAQLGPSSPVAGEAANAAILLSGVSRWIFRKGNKDASQYRVTTSNAVMGVRGTQVYLSFNSVLGETEIISLDGDVDFSSKADVKNIHHVKTGQWGGIGGRFGAQIAPPIDVPAELLKTIRTSMALPTQDKKAKVNAEYYGEAVPAEILK